MEEQETLVNVSSCPTHKYFQHGKQTFTRQHPKKAPVEKLLYAISYHHSAAQKGTRSQRQLHSLLKHMLITFF